MTPQRLLLLLAASSCAAATSTAASSTITTTATSTTSSASLSLTATALAGIVQEAEPCVYLCYDAACIDKDCDAGDFSCICANPNSLVVELGICVGNYCDGSQSFDAGNWMADICDAYDKNPSSTEIASASSIIMSEIAEASATATDNPIPTTTVTAGSTANHVSFLLVAAFGGGAVAVSAIL